MTAAEELTKLEAMYSAWLDAGCPQSYSIHGRTITRASMEIIMRRIDQLRLAVARQSTGGVSVAQFRSPE